MLYLYTIQTTFIQRIFVQICHYRRNKINRLIDYLPLDKTMYNITIMII